MRVYTVISNEKIAIVSDNYEKAKQIEHLTGGILEEVELNKWNDTTLVKKMYNEFIWAITEGEFKKDVNSYPHYKSGIGVDNRKTIIYVSKHRSYFSKKNIYSFSVYTKSDDFKCLEEEYLWAKNVFESIHNRVLSEGLDNIYKEYRN